eukprot:232606_1
MDKIPTVSLLLILVSLNIVIILYFDSRVSYGINYPVSLVATQSTNLTSPNLTYCHTKFSKIVSYSLFGSAPCYIYGALENALIAQIFLPDWQLWFHIHENTFYLEEYSNIFKLLQELNNTKIIIMRNITNSSALFWRFNPFFECPNIDVIISRDCDSRLNGRDQLAVEKWLSTNKKFHFIRDHKHHCTTKILAGLFGARNGYLVKFKSKFMQYYNQLISNQSVKYTYGTDQNFLREEIYPNLNFSDVFIHDQYHCYNETVNQIPYAYSPNLINGIFAGRVICNDFRYTSNSKFHQMLYKFFVRFL